MFGRATIRLGIGPHSSTTRKDKDDDELELQARKVRTPCKETTDVIKGEAVYG